MSSLPAATGAGRLLQLALKAACETNARFAFVELNSAGTAVVSQFATHEPLPVLLWADSELGALGQWLGVEGGAKWWWADGGAESGGEGGAEGGAEGDAEGGAEGGAAPPEPPAEPPPKRARCAPEAAAIFQGAPPQPKNPAATRAIYYANAVLAIREAAAAGRYVVVAISETARITYWSTAAGGGDESCGVAFDAATLRWWRELLGIGAAHRPLGPPPAAGKAAAAEEEEMRRCPPPLETKLNKGALATASRTCVLEHAAPTMPAARWSDAARAAMPSLPAGVPPPAAMAAGEGKGAGGSGGEEQGGASSEGDDAKERELVSMARRVEAFKDRRCSDT